MHNFGGLFFSPSAYIVIFKRLAYIWVQICDATGCFVKALPMGQNIVLDKSDTKHLGQNIEHSNSSAAVNDWVTIGRPVKKAY